MNIYAANIMDHYHRPRNRGRVVDPSREGKATNTNCGDHLGVTLKLLEGKISDIKFEGSGCAISQAAISILSEALLLKTPDQIASYTIKEVENMLGIPISERRRDCALLGLKAIKQALDI